MPNESSQPINAETLNAIVTALGALVFATVRSLPAEGRAGFASDLARLAGTEEANGGGPAALILRDLQRAAESAAG